MWDFFCTFAPKLTQIVIYENRTLRIPKDYMRMKIILIILGVIFLLAGAGLAVLSHPAFGLWRHVSKERIQASPNYRDGMFQNQEPTPQFTGDTASTRGTLWHFLTNKDTLRVPQEPIHAVKTDLKSLPTDSDWLVWFGHSSYLFS